MIEKVKSCFTPHIAMHSLFGLGLGIFLVSIVPALQIIWLGLILMAVSIVLDSMRKS